MKNNNNSFIWQSNNTNMLKVPKSNLRIREKSFIFRASALWNADNIDVYKQRLMEELKCDIYNCDKFCIDPSKYYNE